MKLSCLPCKRSTFFNFPSFPLLLLLCSCYSLHVFRDLSPPVRQKSFAAVKFTDEHGVVIATATSLSCDSAAPLRLQVKLHREPHVFTPTLVISPDNVLHLEIDGLAIAATDMPDHRQWQQRLCHAIARRGRFFYASADSRLLSAITAWLQMLSPPCQITYRPAHGYYCALLDHDSQPDVHTLARIKRRMVRRWQRQPYLLARRLAIALDLSQLIAARDVQRRTRFCHILRHSYPSEMPLIFASTRWQQSVCDVRDAALSFKHAAFGMEAAVQEIELFKQLFERASRRGNVALNLAAPLSHRFWVQLIPTAETRAATVLQYQRVLAARPRTMPTSQCWHPFFSETVRLHKLARAVGLHNGRCAATHYPTASPHDGHDLLGNYLVTTISSETEFVVSNGRTKFLRLPSGTYNYHISHLPNYYLPASPSEVAAGSLRWRDQHRNHQVLR